MPLSRYRGYSLRNRVFWGFLLVCILSMAGSSVLSFYLLKNNAEEQSRSDLQEETNALMAALDYAVSQTPITTKDIPSVLKNKIMEIADINKHDIVIYDLNGNFLISNKLDNLVSQKKVPQNILTQVVTQDRRVDVKKFDQKVKANKTSSYAVLKNNFLEPIGIVYLPYYHNEDVYLDVLNKYLKYMVLVNLLIVIFSIWLSWIISNNLTKAITNFSDLITKITLFEKEMQPIKYYHNDELGALVMAYNKMILQIQDQKERLAFSEKEKAWREMAKQVAHEVKNPLTPMKLNIQNFERKFDPEDPDIREKVKQLSSTMIEQIDLVAKVSSAFSQFAQLPEKVNETFNLNKQVYSILRIFNNDRIFVHANKENIMIHMDKIYLNRIVTNLVTNAKQALEDTKDPIINIDMELIQKKIMISVEDNGTGIPSEMQERIFEPNFTSKNSGMGLGLTMVRKMVEDYGGTITVKSEVGKGSKFIISLPVNL
ncbi:MAG: HAMP domain-containing histidine kinase [Chryseobacterium sp.]|nr:HAMP domain-containing histidine kinase [Chryseobacterium sp.]